MTTVPKKSAGTAKNDYGAENSVRICAAVQAMGRTKFLRASMDSLSVATSNSSESQYYASSRVEPMSWILAVWRNLAKAAV